MYVCMYIYIYIYMYTCRVSVDINYQRGGVTPNLPTNNVDF